MRPFELELIEQPAPAGRLDALRRVREASGLPIAADESVTSPAAAAALLASKAVDVLVLKPMVLGGLRVSLAIAQRAAREGVSCIVTTTIDTGVATAAALHLAAAIPGAPLANGLATAAFLASDLLVAPLPIEAGSMAVPAAPGLGVSVDDAALLRFAAQEQPV
jgi:L-alanine-DL-glutamate epimerase-like enolase superfamily enzyme